MSTHICQTALIRCNLLISLTFQQNKASCPRVPNICSQLMSVGTRCILAVIFIDLDNTSYKMYFKTLNMTVISRCCTFLHGFSSNLSFQLRLEHEHPHASTEKMKIIIINIGCKFT